MSRRTPLLRALSLALVFLAHPVCAGTPPQTPEPTAAEINAARARLNIQKIEDGIDRLLAVPEGKDIDADRVLQVGVEALAADLGALFSEPSAKIVQGLFQQDKRLLPSLSRIYSDGRYAPRLPPIPAEFQKWLGGIQVGEALEQTRKEHEALQGKELTAEQKKRLAALEQRHGALLTLAKNIEAASTSADLQKALGSMSRYFEAGTGKTGASAPSEGVRATPGLKTPPATTAKPPAKGAPVVALPQKSVEPGPGSGYAFLPSLRAAVDALTTSFPAPISVHTMAQKASFLSVRHEATRAGSALAGLNEACAKKSTEVSAADCRSVGDMLRNKAAIIGEMNDARTREDAAAYYSASLRLNAWRDQADGFIRSYMQRWASGQYRTLTDFQKMNAEYSVGEMAAFCTAVLTPATGGAAIFESKWVDIHYPTLSGKEKALKVAKMHGEAGLYCAGKAMTPVGWVLAPVTNTASALYHQAAGGLSVNIGKAKKNAATALKAYSRLADYFGMSGQAKAALATAGGWEAGGRDDISYGAATMMQSHWTLMPRAWMLHAGAGTISDPTGRKTARETEEDLKMFAVNHLREQWGTALPAAAYLGMVNRDPDRAEVLDAVKNGAGGVKGAMKMMLDDAAADWDKGGWGNRMKAGGLWSLVTAVKAGDMAAQSLGFMGVGAGLSALTTNTAAWSTSLARAEQFTKAKVVGAISTNTGRVANAFQVTSHVGQYPFYVGMVEGGLQTYRAIDQGDTRGWMEGSSELAGALGPMIGGHWSAEAKAARAQKRAMAEAAAREKAAAKLSQEYAQDIFTAMGARPALAEAAMGAAAPLAPVEVKPIKAIASLGRQEYRINGQPTRRIGAGNMKDVLVHPDSPDLVVKVYQSGLDPAASGRNMRFEVDRSGMLERAGAAPRIVDKGIVEMNGKERVGYVVQERLRGSTLETMTPLKRTAVAELFDRLVAERIRIVDEIKLEENIMVGETPSSQGLKAYIVDAEIVAKASERGFFDKLTGKADPLRAHYDALLARMSRRMAKIEAPMSMAAESGRKPGDISLDFTRPERIAEEAFTPGERLRAVEGSLSPQERAEFTAFKQGVIGELVREGFSPAEAARELNASFQSMPQFVRYSIHNPEVQAASFVDAIRFRLVESRVQADLVREGYDARRVENFKRRNIELLRGLGVEEAKAEVRKRFAEIDEAVAKAKELRGKTVEERKAADYDELLKYVTEVEARSPVLADYLKPWKNLALEKTYHEALGGKYSLRQRAMEYIDAKASGRVDTYYRTANVEQQRGPSCAIHALYNIIASHGGRAQVPEYAAFEGAVQRMLSEHGRIPGKTTGLSTEQTVRVAKAAGMEATRVERLPADRAQFEALLESRQGAALVSITYREGHTLGQTKAGNHAVFIGEKWVDGEGRTWYSVADSNGGPHDVAFYTWEQLQPRLRSITLLRPAGPPQAFTQEVFRFAGIDPAKPSVESAYTQARKAGGYEYWKVLLTDPALLARGFRDPEFRGLFESPAQFKQYAESQARKAGGGEPMMNAESPVKAPHPRILERIAKEQLPSAGPFRFEPPKKLKSGDPLPVEREGNTKGFVDDYGNVWKRGPYHGKPGPDAPAFEWDVQLSAGGQRMWGQYARGKGYINVKPDGTLSH